MKAPTNEEIGAALLRCLDVLIDHMLVRRAALRETSNDAEYTTKLLPRGMSRRRFNEIGRALHARGNPGVRKRGRDWVIPAAVLEGPPRRKPSVPRDPAISVTGWSVAAALEDAGIRTQQ